MRNGGSDFFLALAVALGPEGNEPINSANGMVLCFAYSPFIPPQQFPHIFRYSFRSFSAQFPLHFPLLFAAVCGNQQKKKIKLFLFILLTFYRNAANNRGK